MAFGRDGAQLLVERHGACKLVRPAAVRTRLPSLRAHGPCPPGQPTFFRQRPLQAELHARTQRRVGLEVVFPGQGRGSDAVHLGDLPQGLALTNGVPTGRRMALLGLQVHAVARHEFMLLADLVVGANLPGHQVQILGQRRLRVPSLNVHKLHAVHGRPQPVRAAQLHRSTARVRLPNHVVLPDVDLFSRASVAFLSCAFVLGLSGRVVGGQRSSPPSHRPPGTSSACRSCFSMSVMSRSAYAGSVAYPHAFSPFAQPS